LGLENDFFKRNPAEIYTSNNEIFIAFHNDRIVLTEEEYQKIYDNLFWGCGACCGFGGVTHYRENGYIIIEGIPCSCHTGWYWSLSLRL
jgi:hypothetical protein